MILDFHKHPAVSAKSAEILALKDSAAFFPRTAAAHALSTARHTLLGTTEGDERKRTTHTHNMVNYRSTALAETAPDLVSSVDSKDVSRIPAILAANQAAERVREEFKKKTSRSRRSSAANKNGAGPLDEEADKAGRYDRRLKMNRQSAAASRVRREAYIKALEQQLLLEHERFSTLRAEFDAERAAHSKLRSDVESARVLAAAPVQPKPALQPQMQVEPEVKQEDFLSDLSLLPQPDPAALNSLLFTEVEQQALPPAAHDYAANVTELFSDLGLPLTQMPQQVAGDLDPDNIPHNIEALMDFETE